MLNDCDSQRKQKGTKAQLKQLSMQNLLVQINLLEEGYFYTKRSSSTAKMIKQTSELEENNKTKFLFSGKFNFLDVLRQKDSKPFWQM